MSAPASLRTLVRNQNRRGIGMGWVFFFFLIFLDWSVPSIDQGILSKYLELHCPIESSQMFYIKYCPVQ